MKPTPVSMAKVVIARLRGRAPEYADKLSDKADAYGMSLFEYVEQRLVRKLKEGERCLTNTRK